MPDAPEESLPPDAPDEEVPLPPDEPVADGMELELPLAPELPAPLLEAPGVLDAPVVDEGDVSLLPLVALLCASAMEDTDATTTNDSERRVVFNVMSNSLLLEKRHQRCSRLDARPARSFSTFHEGAAREPLFFCQAVESKWFFDNVKMCNGAAPKGGSYKASGTGTVVQEKARDAS